MANDLHLPTWNTLSASEDHAIPLITSAFLIAKDEYSELDVPSYLALIRSYADALRAKVEKISLWPLKMAAINQFVFKEIGFTGERKDFYDPRNSYLNEVMERKRGNPLSLALILIEVAHQLGIHLEGISFPGSF